MALRQSNSTPKRGQDTSPTSFVMLGCQTWIPQKNTKSVQEALLACESCILSEKSRQIHSKYADFVYSVVNVITKPPAINLATYLSES